MSLSYEIFNNLVEVQDTWETKTPAEEISTENFTYHISVKWVDTNYPMCNDDAKTLEHIYWLPY